MLRRGLASIWRPGAFGPQSCHNYAQAAAPAFSTTWARASLHTSALGLEGKGPDAKNSPEQKKGVRTDPDMAPPKDDRQSTPSSKKTNELEKGAGAPSGDNHLKPGDKPKPGKGFHTSAGSWADDKKDTDAKDKDDTPDINRGPSGRPDDPHMQVDQAADDHPAPKAG